MINKSMPTALAGGAKMAVKVTAAGGAGLLLYILITNEKVVYLPLFLTVIAVISVFMGGISGGMSAGTQGWLHGFMVALIYTVISTIVRFFLFPESSLDQAILFQTVLLLAAGSIGGVTGINAKYLRRKKRYMGY